MPAAAAPCDNGAMGPLVVAFVTVAAAGCGRVDFGAGLRSMDGGPADVRADGLADDAAPQLGPWGAPIALSAVNSSSDDESPALSPDGLTLVFQSTRPGGAGNSDLYQASRPTTADPFGAATAIAAVNTAAAEAEPTWAPDDLTLYFVRGSATLFVTTRPDPSSAFGPATQVMQVASDQIGGPSLSRDGTELIYTTLAPTALAHASYAAGTGFAIIGPLTELDVNQEDGYGTLGPDELTIYFESTRDNGKIDIFTATRPTRADPFGPVSEISVDTVAADEADPEISADDLTMIYDSDAAGGMGSYDLYLVTRSRL